MEQEVVLILSNAVVNVLNELPVARTKERFNALHYVSSSKGHTNEIDIRQSILFPEIIKCENQ